MKVLVTGAAGFIGGQLWHTLWKRGDEVVGIDNFSYGSMDNLKFDDHDFGGEVRKMDIRDKAGMLALFEAEKFDVVYNIAGIAPLPDCQSDPVQAIEVNTLGLVNLLEAGRRTGIRQLVQASTNAMYENETEFPTVESKFIAVHIQSYPDRLFRNINVIINLFILKNRYPVDQNISCQLCDLNALDLQSKLVGI